MLGGNAEDYVYLNSSSDSSEGVVLVVNSDVFLALEVVLTTWPLSCWLTTASTGTAEPSTEIVLSLYGPHILFPLTE